MAEETIDQIISDPAKLSEALNESFKEQTNTPAEAAPAENKSDDKAEVEVKVTPPADNSSEADQKKSRVETLLEDRNIAKSAAADAQTEVQILTKRIEDLTKLVEGKAGNADDQGANGTADDQNSGKTVAELVAIEVAKLEAAKNATVDAEKSIVDQIQALDSDKETPNANEYTNDLKAVMAKHPTLTAYAAYKMLQGQGIIPMDGVAPSNANRTGTSNRSKTNLLDTKKAEDMTMDEQLAFLKGAEKSGDLKGLI